MATMKFEVADNISTDTSPKEIFNVTSDTLQLLSTLIVLGVLILATVVGNSFVIAAVILERNLRTHFANYLVASLAVADMMVAALVMPVAAIKDVSISHVTSPIFFVRVLSWTPAVYK